MNFSSKQKKSVSKVEFYSCSVTKRLYTKWNLFKCFPHRCQFRSLAQKTNSKLFCSHHNSTPQQGMIRVSFGFNGMDPAMCECTWLLIVVVLVCRLGEEWVCGCGCVRVWVSREGGQEGWI